MFLRGIAGVRHRVCIQFIEQFVMPKLCMLTIKVYLRYISKVNLIKDVAERSSGQQLLHMRSWSVPRKKPEHI